MLSRLGWWRGEVVEAVVEAEVVEAVVLAEWCWLRWRQRGGGVGSQLPFGVSFSFAFLLLL